MRANSDKKLVSSQQGIWPSDGPSPSFPPFFLCLKLLPWPLYGLGSHEFHTIVHAAVMGYGDPPHSLSLSRNEALRTSSKAHQAAWRRLLPLSFLTARYFSKLVLLIIFATPASAPLLSQAASVALPCLPPSLHLCVLDATRVALHFVVVIAHEAVGASTVLSQVLIHLVLISSNDAC